VFTYGPSADVANNLRCDPREVGAELVEVQRGGDVTYHGPGQLVGYPMLSLAAKHGQSGFADTRAYIYSVEQVVIDTLQELGLRDVGRMGEFPGVWVEPDGLRPRKICAIGVRVAKGSTDRRTMHGFALNVSTDLAYMRQHIVPCGIPDYDVTSLHEEGFSMSMRDVVDVIARHAADAWGGGNATRADVAWVQRPEDLSAFSRGEGPGERLTRRLDQAGVTEGLSISLRKPEWLRPRVHHGPEVLQTKKTLRDFNLVTVCEEAGCPNLSECWADGTATFMVLGERCTRACGFCLVDTRKPLAADSDEPARVAEAVKRMRLEFAVLTMVARDDLDDGGMQHVADCIAAIRLSCPETSIETLVSDAKGAEALDLLLAARPDVFNHNIETVPDLYPNVRPGADYQWSLTLLQKFKQQHPELPTKSGIMLGLGETMEQVKATLRDLRAHDVEMVTIGQYLQPTAHHHPVMRYWTPEEFKELELYGNELGFSHVASGPLVRSSYHADRQAAEAAASARNAAGG
jgi:lipoic acid synthetase